MCESPLLHACCLGKLVTICWKLFIFHFTRPRGCFSGCTAERPSQGRAFNCFFAGGSSWQCLTSFLLWKKKKEQNLRNSGKRISAYAWSPLWSLSNKRRSFNLVATGAFHYTRHAQIRARKVSAPPKCPRRVGRPHKVDEHVCDWKCLITNIYFLQHCNHLLIYIYIYILSILCKEGSYNVFLQCIDNEVHSKK